MLRHLVKSLRAALAFLRPSRRTLPGLTYDGLRDLADLHPIPPAWFEE